MKINWDESYSVGNNELDNQHKRWIEFYNALDDMMLGDSTDALRTTKAKILEQMSDYVEYHFEYEEDYMRSISFPEIDRHWRMHKDFRNEIYRICRDHQEGTVVLNSEIMDMIKKWLLEHIVVQDMKIKKHLLFQEGSAK